MHTLLTEKCCDKCWHSMERPCPDWVACVTGKPLCHDDDGCAGKNAARMRTLRREEIDKPIFFVGAGTCGLAAGAGKTLAAIRADLTKRGIDAEVVEVGCVGLCSAEPIVDLQLPGRPRLMFTSVTEENAVRIVDAITGEIPEELLLGQYRTKETQQWEDLPYMDEHPFFKPQTRLVLRNCGVIDPSSIDEYI
ncbi:MAG: CCxxC motif-containing NuoF prefix domain-containing protein, partial [Candidatus Auribacterota bacterium]|nr:CCxxC motif-containing NuoF prefix domain-containing protein [Candidatus Auribacterota bacterium]